MTMRRARRDACCYADIQMTADLWKRPPMFTGFFYDLRRAGVPVSLKEYLALMEAMQAGIAGLCGRGFLLPVPRHSGEG